MASWLTVQIIEVQVAFLLQTITMSLITEATEDWHICNFHVCCFWRIILARRRDIVTEVHSWDKTRVCGALAGRAFELINRWSTGPNRVRRCGESQLLDFEWGSSMVEGGPISNNFIQIHMIHLMPHACSEQKKVGRGWIFSVVEAWTDAQVPYKAATSEIWGSSQILNIAWYFRLRNLPDKSRCSLNEKPRWVRNTRAHLNGRTITKPLVIDDFCTKHWRTLARQQRPPIDDCRRLAASAYWHNKTAGSWHPFGFAASGWPRFGAELNRRRTCPG